jgi:hypothetical protein
MNTSGYPYHFHPGYGSAQQYTGTYNAAGPVPPSNYVVNGYDPTALQLRIIRAKQVNVLCKQALVRNYLLGKVNEISERSGATQQLAANTPSGMSANYYRSPPALGAAQNMPRPVLDRANMLEESLGQLHSPPRSRESGAKAATPKDSASRPRDDRTAAAPVDSSVAAPAKGLEENYGDPDDDAVAIDQSTPAPDRKAAHEDAKLLDTLAESMTKTVADSGTVLKKLNAKKNRVPAAEKAKRKVDQLIKISANAPAVMPLWRHKLNGRLDPPPETILKGKRLLRLIVRVVLYMFVRPTVAVMRRKLNAREVDRKDLQKTLKLLAGSFDDWLGKLVQLPVTSVAQVRARDL